MHTVIGVVGSAGIIVGMGASNVYVGAVVATVAGLAVAWSAFTEASRNRASSKWEG